MSSVEPELTVLGIEGEARCFTHSIVKSLLRYHNAGYVPMYDVCVSL